MGEGSTNKRTSRKQSLRTALQENEGEDGGHKTTGYTKSQLFKMVDTDGSGHVDEQEFGILYDVIKSEAEAEFSTKRRLEETVKGKEKTARRYRGAFMLIMAVVCCMALMNMGLTAAVVYLVKDTAVGTAGTLFVKETLTPVRTAEALVHHAIDSRLPDEVWDEMKYIEIKSDSARLHLFVHGTKRTTQGHHSACGPLYGTYMEVYTAAGTITLDGDTLSYEEGMHDVFERVVSRQDQEILRKNTKTRRKNIFVV